MREPFTGEPDEPFHIAIDDSGVRHLPHRERSERTRCGLSFDRARIVGPGHYRERCRACCGHMFGGA